MSQIVSHADSGVSFKQLRANRKNARSSTGPQTLEGKNRSARNATRHGIFSSAMLLPGEDPDQLKQLRDSAIRHFDPRDGIEMEIVEQYVSASWRLRRVRAAEAKLYQHVRNDAQLPDAPADQVLGALLSEERNELERYQRYERRLEDSIHRSINQLRKLRDDHEVGCLSDYAGAMLDEMKESGDDASEADNAAVQNEPKSVPAIVSSDGGEGYGAATEVWSDSGARNEAAQLSDKTPERARLRAA
jgi:hypothetical protein